MAGLQDFVDETDSKDEQLHVMQVEYEEQYGDPLIHLWCRDQDNNKRWVEVEGHRPSFYIAKDAYSKRVKNHDWVETVDGGYESIHGDSLAKVETTLPWHVGGKQNKKGLRDYFENTWEADVFYTSRFLIDTGIKTHMSVDLDATWDGQSVQGDYRVHVDDIDAVEDPDWRADPRMVTIDIEVLSPDGFPDPDEAKQPVTAITAHDNHTDEYMVWVLRYEGWAYSDTEIQNMVVDRAASTSHDGDHDYQNVVINDVRVFENESVMLDDFNKWVSDTAPDLLSGWNSSTTDNGRPFDYPYLINRCKSRNVMSYRDWSPLGQVWDGNWGPSGKGVGFFDMLKSYKKTQWQKPKGGYSLDNISDTELVGDATKLEIEDIDTAWRDDVGTFLEYNIRDVKAVVGINEAAEVVDLFQNIRALAGVQFENCHNNIDLLDVFILRYAKEMGVALPTNEEPTRGWYYGAHVFEPKLGRHPNVVYPDLWSMYPNMIRNCNMSPETLIGTKDDLDASEYTEDDCRWTYVDTRNTNVKKSDDPEYEKLYFLKPSVKTGFMTEVVDDLMDLKDFYDGTALYDAVKRIVNSVYGVYGDSDSYGKGYRLFDWRIAEGITLGGRKEIQDSADRFIDAINDIKDERGIEGTNAYLVGGDTDSVMTAIPFMDAETREDQQKIVNLAHEAAERVNDWYDEWTAETFNLTEGDHYCELEIESYAPWAFVPEGKTKEKAKKRYAEIIAWDEGDWEDPPAFSVTGIDIVRSDRAVVTRELSEDVLQTILRVDDRETARDRVYESISSEVDAIKDGAVDMSHIARPKGMSQHPSEYGSPDKTPQPTYRGAKYANQHFDWEKMGEGAKPQLLYIDKVRGDYPSTYTAETREDGREVDAIAVEHPEKVPDTFTVDREKMIEKVLRDPLEPILGAMRWDWDEALADSTQGSLSEFM
jgi:DNA polymerase I